MVKVSKLCWLTKQDKIWLLSLCLWRISSSMSSDSERGSNLRDSCCQRSRPAAPTSLPEPSLHLLPLYCVWSWAVPHSADQLTRLGEKVAPFLLSGCSTCSVSSQNLILPSDVCFQIRHFCGMESHKLQAPLRKLCCLLTGVTKSSSSFTCCALKNKAYVSLYEAY